MFIVKKKIKIKEIYYVEIEKNKQKLNMVKL